MMLLASTPSSSFYLSHSETDTDPTQLVGVGAGSAKALTSEPLLRFSLFVLRPTALLYTVLEGVHVRAPPHHSGSRAGSPAHDDE